MKNEVKKNASLAVPDSQKDEVWHKSYHDLLLRRCYFVSEPGRDIEYLYNYYHGKVDPQQDHNHLITSDSGVMYPVDFINYNKILGFVEVMLGQLHRNGASLEVVPTSKKAISKKREKELELETDFRLLPFYAEQQQATGLPLIRPDMPKTPEELREKKMNAKEFGQVVYQRLLDWYQKKIAWSNQRELLAEDGLVAGRIFVESKIVNGLPKFLLKDIRKMVFDRNMKSPWGEDAEYVGEIEYIPLRTAMEEHGLSVDEAQKLRDRKSQGSASVGIGFASANKYPLIADFDGEEYILRTSFYWKDVKTKVGLHYQNANTKTSHFHLKDAEINEADRKAGIDTASRRKKAKETTTIQVEIIRKCIVLGDHKVVEWGLLENQVRTFDDWHHTKFPIVFFLPKWKFGTNNSIVELLVPLQKLVDRCNYQVQKAMKKDRGVFFINDTTQIPDGYTEEDQMYFAEILGMIPVTSRILGANSNYQSFQAVDMSLRESVRIYMEIAAMAANEMRDIVGIPKIAEGQLMGSAQTVGTTQIAQQQGTIRTERFFRGFDRFTEMFFELVLGQFKICIGKDPEKFRPLIGDDGVEYVMKDVDFNLDDYGTFLNTSYRSDHHRNLLLQHVPQAMANGLVPFLDGLDLMLEDNPREVKERLNDFMEKNRKREQQMKEQEMAMAQSQGEQQSAIQAATVEAQNRKVQADVERTRLQQRATIMAERLRGNNQQNKTRIEASSRENSARITAQAKEKVAEMTKNTPKKD